MLSRFETPKEPHLSNNKSDARKFNNCLQKRKPNKTLSNATLKRALMMAELQIFYNPDWMKNADQRQGELSLDIKSKSAKPYKTSKKHAWPLRRSLKIHPEVLILEIISQLDEQLVPNQKPCHVSQRSTTAPSPHIKKPTTPPSRPRPPPGIPIDFRPLPRSKPSIGNRQQEDARLLHTSIEKLPESPAHDRPLKNPDQVENPA